MRVHGMNSLGGAGSARVAGITWMLIILILVSAMLVGGACTRQGTAILRVSLWNYNPWVDDTFFDEFRRAHPNIEVIIETESWSNYHTKLKTQILTGTAPDVMIFNASDMYGYCEGNVLLDIADYIERDTMNLDAFFDNSVASCKWNGSMYGLPLSNDVSVLYVNVDMCERLGVDVPPSDSVMTWYEFQDLCRKLKHGIDALNEDSADFVYVEDAGWADLYTAVLQNDGQPFDRYENPRRCLLNSPEAIDAAEYYLDLSLKYGYSPNIIEYVTIFRSVPSTLFAQEKFPLYLGHLGNRFLDEVSDKFNLAVLPRPQGKRRIHTMKVTVATINATTKYPDEAWQLLRYFTDTLQQAYIAKNEALGGLVPAREDVANSDALLPDYPNIRYIILDELEHSIPLIKSAKTKELGFLINPVFEQLAMGQITIKEAMQTITNRANTVLSED